MDSAYAIPKITIWDTCIKMLQDNHDVSKHKITRKYIKKYKIKQWEQFPERIFLWDWFLAIHTRINFIDCLGLCFDHSLLSFHSKHDGVVKSNNTDHDKASVLLLFLLEY